MKGTFFLLIALQMATWVSATSRAFAPNYGLAVVQPGREQSPKSSQARFKSNALKSDEASGKVPGMFNVGDNKLGSSPPSCEHKCYGCTPCEAIQVPTNNSHSHVGVQYANYEPEGWKCKCGPSFYTP